MLTLIKPENKGKKEKRGSRILLIVVSVLLLFGIAKILHSIFPIPYYSAFLLSLGFVFALSSLTLRHIRAKAKSERDFHEAFCPREEE